MIKVSADSTCDLSPDILAALNISITPLSIIVEDKSFRDGEDITPADIFRYVDYEGKSCHTAAINMYDYYRHFEKLSSQYDAVIQICLGSNFSSCYQNAAMAAQEFENVYVIDSRNLSSGSGHIVYEAALMARDNVAPQEICSRLEQLIPRIEASFVIDRLDYLHRGGRCSGLTAQGAKLLQIKPCIEVIDGKMLVGKKYQGEFEKCLKKYVKDRLCDRTDIDYSRIFVTHPMCSPETVAMVKEEITKYADFQEIIETKAGCTVSNHCGPNTLGILFKRK